MGSVYGGIMGADGVYTVLNLNTEGTASILSTNPCTVHRVVVNTPPTGGVIGVYDTVKVSGATAVNLVCTWPTTTVAGTVIELHWPCQNGLVVQPGTGGVVSVVWQ